jgi:hypothetical protein
LLGIESLSVWCSGDQGGVDIGALTLLGQRVAVPTVKQSATIPAAPLATITVNQQTKHADGAFTITGLTINLGGAQTIRLASATCSKPAAKPTPKPTHPTTHPVPAPEQPAPAAPTPTPVKTHHPVTG